MQKFVLKTMVKPGDPEMVCEFLAGQCRLSKGKIKDAMQKGAVWSGKSHGRQRRVRRAKTVLQAGDVISFYYDEELLARIPPTPWCLADHKGYSVWYKPAGLLAQGTNYGDHCSLGRQAQRLSGRGREVYVVHRLDREASGLMVLAHTREAAAGLSALFQRREVDKGYRVEVLGDPLLKVASNIIDLPLDGKPTITLFAVESHYPHNNTSIVRVSIKTGRLHQIRRHFAMIGCPVIGDPVYGKGNKNSSGMRLTAISLRFCCPITGRDVEFFLDETRWSAAPKAALPM